MNTTIKIEVGQIWKDRDSRMKNRHLRVVEIVEKRRRIGTTFFPEKAAKVESVTFGAGGWIAHGTPKTTVADRTLNQRFILVEK